MALVFAFEGKNRSNWGKGIILYSFLTRSLDNHFGLSFRFLLHFIDIKVHPRYALYYQQNLAEIVKGLLWIRSTLSIIAFFFFFFWVIKYEDRWSVSDFTKPESTGKLSKFRLCLSYHELIYCCLWNLTPKGE